MSEHRAEERLQQRWGRRALTLPAFFLLTPIYLGALVPLLVFTLLVDVSRGRPLPATRASLFLAWYLIFECAGLLGAAWIWLSSSGGSRERFLARNFRLQCWWASGLFAGAERLFSLRVTVEGEEALAAGGPLLVFMRHASLADTLLPAVFLSDRHGLRLRWVLKREVLWDPCLDVVGQRLPNAFVRRGSGEAAREIALVQDLASELESDEGVMIYPEGTRFTQAKRERVLQRFEEEGDAAALARARELQHVLPPRPGGPLGLIEAREGCDVLFVGHVGFDGIATAGDVLGGALIGRRVAIRYWRVAADEIPAGRDERARWLYGEWRKLDAWIGAQRCDTGLDPA